MQRRAAPSAPSTPPPSAPIASVRASKRPRVGHGDRFGPDYYRRYYERPATKVHDAARVAHLGRFLTSFIAWSEAELTSVLDVGAGAGFLRDWFARHHPDVRYRSIEYSEYACTKYGHERRDITAFRARERYDLVVCQGVLQYIDDAGAVAAIDNLGAMARGFLYLEAITRHDFDAVCEKARTDGDVHLRPGSFYREHLGRHFQQVGAGLWYSKNGPLNFYELEAQP